jgi:hypothetical protein
MLEIQPRKFRQMKLNRYVIAEIRDGDKRYCRNLNIAYWSEEEMTNEEKRAMKMLTELRKPPIEWWLVTSKRRPKSPPSPKSI